MIASGQIGSVAEWAKKENISREAAYKRIREHGIPMQNGKLNFDQADRIWMQSYNPLKQKGGAAAAAAGVAQPDLFSQPAAGDDAPADPLYSPQPMNTRTRQALQDVQLIREKWRAQREGIEVKALLGEVVPIAQVAQFYTEVFNRMMGDFGLVGAELMDALAMESSSIECRRIVDTRINKILRDLAEWKP